MLKENLSNHNRRNDEFLNSKEIEKEGVRGEEDRISNNDKKPDDENLLSKGSKSERNEDIKNESNAVSDGNGVPGLIQIKNSNRKKSKLERLASLNAFFADTSEPDLLCKLEREQIEKEQQQENYQNVEVQDNTKEAQIDAATYETDKAI